MVGLDDAAGVGEGGEALVQGGGADAAAVASSANGMAPALSASAAAMRSSSVVEPGAACSFGSTASRAMAGVRVPSHTHVPSCSPAFGSGGRDGRMPRERIANQSNWQCSRRQAANDGASQFPFPHVVEPTGSGSARILWAHHCHEKNLVSFYFASSIILCASNSVSQFQTLLLSVESENSPGNSDDGNKTKTIGYRDLKMRRIPSKIMLRLTSTTSSGWHLKNSVLQRNLLTVGVACGGTLSVRPRSWAF
jgi:hypothetical protein